jgi:hypothetical protein
MRVLTVLPLLLLATSLAACSALGDDEVVDLSPPGKEDGTAGTLAVPVTFARGEVEKRRTLTCRAPVCDIEIAPSLTADLARYMAAAYFINVPGTGTQIMYQPVVGLLLDAPGDNATDGQPYFLGLYAIKDADGKVTVQSTSLYTYAGDRAVPAQMAILPRLVAQDTVDMTVMLYRDHPTEIGADWFTAPATVDLDLAWL